MTLCRYLAIKSCHLDLRLWQKVYLRQARLCDVGALLQVYTALFGRSSLSRFYRICAAFEQFSHKLDSRGWAGISHSVRKPIGYRVQHMEYFL
jgi:hypothetical protein